MISPYVVPGIGEKIPMEIIKEALCLKYTVTEKELLGSSRGKAELSFVRHLIMYFMRQQQHDFKPIGEALNRDRTTAMHAQTVIRNYMDTDGSKRQEIADAWEFVISYYHRKAA